MRNFANIGEVGRFVVHARNTYSLGLFAAATTLGILLLLTNSPDSSPAILVVSVLFFVACLTVLSLRYRSLHRDLSKVLNGMRPGQRLDLVSPFERALNAVGFSFALGFALPELWKFNVYLAAVAAVGVVCLYFVAWRILRSNPSPETRLCPSCSGEIEAYWVACPFCRWDLISDFSAGLYRCSNGHRMSYRGTFCYDCGYAFGFCPQCRTPVPAPNIQCNVCDQQISWCSLCGLANNSTAKTCKSCLVHLQS